MSDDNRHDYEFSNESYDGEHRPPVAAAILILGALFFALGLLVGAVIAAFGG